MIVPLRRILPLRRGPAYGVAVAVTVVVLGLRVLAASWLGWDRPLLLLLILPIIISAYLGGARAGLLSTLLVAIGSECVAVVRTGTLEFANAQDLSLWLVMVLNGVLVSLICEALHRARTQAEAGLLELQRSEESLRSSERLHRLIYEQSPVPKWIFDPVTLRFLSVNAAAQRHYGYSEAEFLAMTIRNIRPEEDLPALEKDIAGARGTNARASEWRHRLKDGTMIDVIVTAHDVEFEGRRARFVIAQDITELKRSEAKLQSQLARLDLLSRITRAIGERQDLESIFQVVIRSLEENLPIDLCCMCLYDAAAQRLTVIRVGVHNESLGLEIALTPQANIPIDENGLSRCIRGRLVYEPDTNQVDFPFPRRLARAGLRSVVFAPLLVESQVFGVFIGARRVPNGFSSSDCEFLRQVSEHTALAANQAQLYGALQRAYDDLRQTQQAIIQQERLRSLGQMASGIAHDINNAISPATLYTESLLSQEQGLSARGREKLEVVQHALDDVAATVARMREFYRQREPELQLAAVDANRVMQQVVELTRARWNDLPQQRGVMIALEMNLAPDLPRIMGVESEIREALTNLVFNAADAMPDGGLLRLRTRVSAAGSGALKVLMEVTDSGVGMDAETQRRCLEPFFTTKGERGTGMGLAMVYGMTQRHNAELQIESSVGFGTTMRLCFAAAPDGVAAPPTKESAAPVPRMRLLLIDDDPLLLKSLRDALEAEGHVVATANGGQKGIETFLAARGGAEPFAAVVTDLGMPYVDGRKVAAEIKAASPETPIILLTGWGQRLAAEGEVPLNVDRVLAKPPTLRELRAALAACRAASPPSPPRAHD